MTSNTCPECGAPCGEGLKHCPECGIPLTAVEICAECGARYSSESAVCPECGAPSKRVVPERTAPAPAVPRTVPSAYPGTQGGVIASGQSHPPAKGLLGVLSVLNLCSAICFIIEASTIAKQVNAIIQSISELLQAVDSSLASIVNTINKIPGVNINLNLNFTEGFAAAVEGFKEAAALPVIQLMLSFVVIPILMTIVYINISRGYRITVTRGNIEGKRPFLGTVTLPMSSVSDVKTDIVGNVAVYCFGKRYVFKEIDNSDKVYSAIRDIIAGSGSPR